MIITSTNDIKGYKITKYLGLINMNVVVGVNFFSDFFASLTDVFGGYSSEYQSKLDKIYADATTELKNKATALKADAIIGIHFDFDEISGKGKQMFMVTAYGTAVKAEPVRSEQIKTERYDIYQKLYNLSKFKESGIINDEQYETERKSLLLAYEDDINKEIEEIKSVNHNIEVVKQAQLDYQQQKEKERISIEKAKEELAKQKMTEMTEKEKFACLRKEKENEINDAINVFISNAPTILNKVREYLEDNIKNPKDALDKLTPADVTNADYSDMGLNSADNAAHNIGLILQKERYADACRYYIDLVNDDNLDEAKYYINSIYDMLSFKNLDAFVSMGKNLVELKTLGKAEEAANEFSSYALCNKETSKCIIDLL